MIYFAHDKSHDAIKIGFTAGRVERRLQQLQWGTLAKLTLLGQMSGDKVVEAQLHEMFANLHISGEWFRDDRQLRTFIERNTPAERCDQLNRRAPKKPGYKTFREMCEYGVFTTAELLYEVENTGIPHCHFGRHLYFPMKAVREWLMEVKPEFFVEEVAA